MLPGEKLATLARLCGYRVKTMADELGYSCRWMEIHCYRQFKLTPHAWLARLRTEEIQRQARTGASAKLLCRIVGFADPGIWTFWKARSGQEGLGFIRRQQLGAWFGR